MQGDTVRSLQIFITVNSSESTLRTPVMSSEVIAAETHLAPYWEGRGWELLEGYQLHCFHCSPCRHSRHCCHCRERDRERRRLCDDHQEDVSDKLNYMTAFDIVPLLSHMSNRQNNILITVATDLQFCKYALYTVRHIRTRILGKNLGAYSHTE